MLLCVSCRSSHPRPLHVGVRGACVVCVVCALYASCCGRVHVFQPTSVFHLVAFVCSSVGSGESVHRTWRLLYIRRPAAHSCLKERRGVVEHGLCHAAVRVVAPLGTYVRSLSSWFFRIWQRSVLDSVTCAAAQTVESLSVGCVRLCSVGDVWAVSLTSTLVTPSWHRRSQLGRTLASLAE